MTPAHGADGARSTATRRRSSSTTAAATARYELMQRGARTPIRASSCVRLSRNFGHQIALTAGRRRRGRRRGDRDGRRPAGPARGRARARGALARGLRRRLRGARRARGRDARSSARRRRASTALFRRISRRRVPLDVGDFRLVDRRALDVVPIDAREQPLRARHVQLDRATARPASRSRARGALRGRDEVPAAQDAALRDDGHRSASRPTRCGSRSTSASSSPALSFLLGHLVPRRRRSPASTACPGWTSIVVVVAFLGGIQLIVLGVIGEYIGPTSTTR